MLAGFCLVPCLPMSEVLLSPPLTSPAQLNAQFREHGYAVLDAATVASLSGVSLEGLRAMARDWDALPPDLYLRDGGRYRRRRHASYVAEGALLHRTVHRAHWQPLEYNALHGGMQRWFEPVTDATEAHPAWRGLLGWLCELATSLWAGSNRGVCQGQPWYVETHQFRIDTTDGIGRPTPEGAHRDGVDLVAVFLVGREGVKGGETRVFDANGPGGQRFTLTEPWSVLLLDDARVIHESTPIQPLAGGGHRDTLVVTLRSGGFQEDQARAVS